MKYLLTIIMSVAMLSTAFADEPKHDTLKDALAEMLTGVTQTAGQAKDFLVSEIPEVVRQLLMWKAAESIISTVVAAAFLAAAALILRKAFKDEVFTDSKNGSYSLVPKRGWARVWLGVFSAICTIVGMVWFIGELTHPSWLQIWIAPKVYLIEYARSFVK